MSTNVPRLIRLILVTFCIRRFSFSNMRCLTKTKESILPICLLVGDENYSHCSKEMRMIHILPKGWNETCWIWTRDLHLFLNMITVTLRALYSLYFSPSVSLFLSLAFSFSLSLSIYIFIHTHTHTHTHTRTPHIYICIYIYVDAHTHTHIYIWKLISQIEQDIVNILDTFSGNNYLSDLLIQIWVYNIICFKIVSV